MRNVRQAIEPIAIQVIGNIAVLLAIIGLPVTILVALLFRPKSLRSSRPGKLGMEDCLRGFFGLAWKCGLATAVLAVVAFLLDR